jgi:hypothetical protein
MVVGDLSLGKGATFLCPGLLDCEWGASYTGCPGLSEWAMCIGDMDAWDGSDAAVWPPFVSPTLSPEERMARRHQGLVEALRPLVRFPLLLHAVQPGTLWAYMRGLVTFLRWHRLKGRDPSTVGELDDYLGEYIQEAFDAWRLREGGPSRQSCVDATAGMVLLYPRLGGQLRVSSRLLEAWRRVNPSAHFPPLPYGIMLVFVSTLWSQGHWALGIWVWLSHHCLFRPGEPFRMLVKHVILDGGPRELLAGAAAVVQVPLTKTGRPVRILGIGDDAVLRPKQVAILDRALAVVLWLLTFGRPPTNLSFAWGLRQYTARQLLLGPLRLWWARWGWTVWGWSHVHCAQVELATFIWIWGGRLQTC